MAAILPALALKINTDQFSYSTGVLNTLIFTPWKTGQLYSSPVTTVDTYGNTATYYGSGYLESMQCEDKIIPVFDVRETLSQYSPRTLVRTGYGVRLQFDLQLEWLSDYIPDGKYYPDQAYPAGYTPSVTANTSVVDLDTIVNALATTNSGVSDTYARYLWLSPNYGFQNEQWIRVEIAPDGFSTGFGQKTWTRKATLSLQSADLYKSVTRGLESRGWTYAGCGTVSYSGSGTLITGVNTSFLTDFVAGDSITIATALGTAVITSITSNTQLNATLPPGQPSLSGKAYTVVQQGSKYFYVPYYTITQFAPNPYGWGYNWGNVWSGSS